MSFFNFFLNFFLFTVMKYRKGDEDTFIDKISKLSMHSIIKKSNRVSSHLKQLTGMAPQVGIKKQTNFGLCDFGLFCSKNSSSFSQFKDEVFDEAEKKFRLQERLIKTFIRDISLYLQHLRVKKNYFLLQKMCEVQSQKRKEYKRIKS